LKRDLDLVRRILLRIEESADGAGSSTFVDFTEEGYELPSVYYHVRLLNDAGLIEADELVPGQWWPERMTWAGHEFLDAARSDELWNEVKDQVLRGGGSAPFDLFHELLVRKNRERLENFPGRHSSKRSRSGRMKKSPKTR
jgi:DNA-binding transcriptional ArsR family regulator